VVCGKKVKDYLCEECKKKDSISKDELFIRLKKEFNIRSFYFLSEYSGDFRKRLLRLKNKRDKGLLRDLSRAFVKKNHLKSEEFDLVCFVPGRRGRSFHSGELAREIAEILNVTFSPGLIVKKKKTRQLKTLNRVERKKEIKGAFRLNPTVNFKKNSKILLVDDIITTGTTVSEILSLFGDVELSVGVLGVTPAEKQRKREKNLDKKI